MNFPRRQALFCLLALMILAAPLLVLAQQETILVRGSQLVSTVVGPLSDAYQEQSGAAVTVEITGTDTGLADLCSGEIDIAMAARPITRAEEAACAENDVQWVEVPLGSNALVVIANPAFTFVDCLTFPQLAALWGPSAANTTTIWDQINPDWGAMSFVPYAPPQGSAAYGLLDDLLPGDGLRADATIEGDPQALVSRVTEDVAGVGLVPWNAVAGGEADVRLIALDELEGAGCVAPSPESIADDSYPAMRGLYLYVSAASLEREAVSGLVQSMLAEDGQAVVAEQGFTPLTEAQVEQATANVAEGVTGRQFSEGEPLYTIAFDVSGTVTVESAAAAYPPLNDVANAFTDVYTGVTITKTAFGNPAAYRKLCNGEIDLATVTRAPTDEEAAVCEQNDVSLWEVPLGHQAVVMLVPAEADFAACLTTEQIGNLWQDQGGDSVVNWNQLGEDFPDLPLTIFLPRDGESQTDFLLFQSTREILNPRRDALQESNDGLWRAAATANVEGAITYVDFVDFQATEADVIPVAVDAGNGCVTPSLETIRDGSYLFARPVSLQISQDALARPAVQALVWYLLSNSSRSLLEDQQVIVFDDATFRDYQETAVEKFIEAEARAAAEAQATETPTEEATSEATETPTEEPTAESGS